VRKNTKILLEKNKKRKIEKKGNRNGGNKGD